MNVTGTLFRSKRNYAFRYGDELNPWGDIIAIGRAWCQMKSGSMALVAVPAAKDTICFNGHRLYGPFLYQHLFSNWKIIYSEVDKNVESRKVDCTSPKTYSYQPVIIIQK